MHHADDCEVHSLERRNDTDPHLVRRQDQARQSFKAKLITGSNLPSSCDIVFKIINKVEKLQPEHCRDVSLYPR